MKKARILPVFTDAEREKAKFLLAARVCYMMGQKLEEADWGHVYCTAKGIPNQRWSNLKIDVMHDGLGVEHKMLCYRSHTRIREACGSTLMHPAATRSIRIPSLDLDPQEAMAIILNQYAELIRNRREAVRKNSPSGTADMRTGWLLWQESLEEFLYWEEEMLEPDPADYVASWKEKSIGKSRKSSKNLWVYERETNRKRYSITTEAGAKIQPYFDVPLPTEPNLEYFIVKGETTPDGRVKVWITDNTARELRRFFGAKLDELKISEAIIHAADQIGSTDHDKVTVAEIVECLLLNKDAYESLISAFPGVNDDHCIQLLLQHLATTT